MYGIGKTWVTAAAAITVALSSLSHAEGYPDRNSGLPNRPNTYYGDLIAAQRKANPQGSGESDGAYQARINQLAADSALTAPQDTSDPNGGTVDRGEKLADAALLAGEGKKAATTQSANLLVWAMTQGLNGAASAPANGGTSGAAAAAANASMATAAAKGAQYAATAKDMELAAYHNGTGKARVRTDPDDNDPEAGTPGASPPPSLAQTVANSLPPTALAKLAERGLDPEKVAERLLSGEVDTSDVGALLKELGDTRQLSVDELAESKRLAEVQLNDPGFNPLDSDGVGGQSRVKDEVDGGRSDRTQNKGEKGEKDGKEASDPGLAGIAIRLINRDVMGFKLGEFLGITDKKTAAASLKRAANTRGLAKGPGAKKSLTAVDFYRLKDNGVTAPRHGSNIFTIAHREYRDFTKWRTVKGKGRVAAN